MLNDLSILERSENLMVLAISKSEGNLHWNYDMQLTSAKAVYEFKPFLETKDVNGKSKDYKWAQVMTHLKSHADFEHVKYNKVLRKLSMIFILKTYIYYYLEI